MELNKELTISEKEWALITRGACHLFSTIALWFYQSANQVDLKPQHVAIALHLAKEARQDRFEMLQDSLRSNSHVK